MYFLRLHTHPLTILSRLRCLRRVRFQEALIPIQCARIPPFVLSPYPKLMPKFPLILLCPYSPRRPRPLCAWNTL